jgi:hypothetical protein
MRLQSCSTTIRVFLLAGIVAISMLGGCERHRMAPAPPSPPAISQSSTAQPFGWTEVFTPSPAVDITAVGNVFWVCGVDEMIASSSDGGNTWSLKHQIRGGAVLLNIAFVNAKIGHAAGKNGVLLSTTDGGKTWRSHTLVADPRKLAVTTDIQKFSFADADNGIAIVGDQDINRSSEQPMYYASPMNAAVELTHDGGKHWQEVSAFGSADPPPFSRVQAVAALDSSHYLMILNHPQIEDAFVITADGGRTWKVIHQRDDETNRDFAKQVFVHDGEYWAFGKQLLNRQSRGGYMEAMTRHSKDGQTWLAGTSSASDMGVCNIQGCYLWDGAVEALYDATGHYWNLPQDGSLSAKWAIAGNRVCTIGTIVQCAPAVSVEKPQPRPRYPPHSPGQPFKVSERPFAPDCTTCGVKVIRLDPGKNWQGRVVVTFTVDQGGAVTDLSEDGAPEGPLGALIEDQVQHWRFKPTTAGATAPPRHVPIDVKCIDAADVPTMDGCQLLPGKWASGN